MSTVGAGHLATARAAGVPGRMSLSTRLQFLVAQTDVSGVWGEPRRTRLTVYLAGMVVNLVVAAVCVLTLAAVAPTGLVADLLAATMLVSLLSLLSLPFEFMLFLRSDVYFVVQDLTGCANLYASGSAYARHLTKRLWHRMRCLPPPEDPSQALPTAERHAVRTYTVVLVVGTRGVSRGGRGHHGARPGHRARRRGGCILRRHVARAVVRRRRGVRGGRRRAVAVGQGLVAPPRPTRARAGRPASASWEGR
jgi:hypothetical protein